MARYIDADKFKSNLERAMEKMHLIGGVKGVDVCAVIHALDRQPAADVVEVVRCKECKHFMSNYCTHDLAMNYCCGNDFCSYGERKEQT